jgi:hypothetical protein
MRICSGGDRRTDNAALIRYWLAKGYKAVTGRF